MDSKTILLIGVGVAAYVLFQRRQGGTQYRVPGQTMGGAPRYPTAPSVAGATEAAAYRDIGSLIGGIYRRVSGGASSDMPVRARPVLPDDTVPVNPAGNVDPYDFETALWGYGD